MVRDAYELFFDELVSKEDFFKFGLKEIIFANGKKVNASWEDLKNRLKSNKPVYIRGYGGQGRNSHLYQIFYEHVFGNENIQIDKNNNLKPKQLLEELTGYMKSPKQEYKPIQNYQISHVFGRTKNALAFTAPWNIVYIPKLIDPFTGHEAKGSSVSEFTRMFQKKCFDQFEEMIQEFNDIMISDKLTTNLSSSIDYVLERNEELSESQKKQFEKSVYSEFEPIRLK